MKEPFANAPDAGKAFDASKSLERSVRAPEYDAADWEPADDREDDAPDELRHDPPRKEFDPGLVMEPTPFGTVVRDVAAELDPATRRAMHEARERTRETDDEFADLRSIDDVPGAAEEYEEHLHGEEPWQDDYERRIRERFNRMREQSRDREP